jgi:hypothetical protein
MREYEENHWPVWAERERTGDLAWIGENLHVFWPAAQQGYESLGRGAIVVDTISRPTGGGNPFVYLPQEPLKETADANAQRMVRQYDPSWELVAVLLKSRDRVSVYRLGVPSQKSGE